MASIHSKSFKVVGQNGQISLGKQFAGRQVIVEEQETGVWLIRTASIIPDNERWVNTPKASSDLKAALAWSAKNPPSDLNADQIIERLSDSAK
jgi:hypothetical protein